MEAKDYTTPESVDLKRIKLNLTYLDKFLKEWYDKKEALKTGDITQEEYYECKINWPKF